MNNFNNYLMGMDIDEKCFKFVKEELQKEYNLNLVLDLISLPCMNYRQKDKLFLLLNLIRDNEVNDSTVFALCELLRDIGSVLWSDIVNILAEIIESKYHLFNREQQLHLAHTIELLYAKGFSLCIKQLQNLYERISLSNIEFSPDSEENIRIRLAKCAYSCNQYNFTERIDTIKAVKAHLKASKNTHLLGTLYYYKAICMGNIYSPLDGKDLKYYMMKSDYRGFALATTYLHYIRFHSETSKVV